MDQKLNGIDFKKIIIGRIHVWGNASLRSSSRIMRTLKSKYFWSWTQQKQLSYFQENGRAKEGGKANMILRARDQSLTLHARKKCEAPEEEADTLLL